MTLKPLTVQEAFDELTDYLLGSKYYIVDPVSGQQANAIIVDDIKKLYNQHDKSDKVKYRERHKKCEYCTYCHYRHTPPEVGFTWKECELSDNSTKNYKAKLCKFYKVRDT